jgi:hypothetical protein
MNKRVIYISAVIIVIALAGFGAWVLTALAASQSTSSKPATLAEIVAIRKAAMDLEELDSYRYTLKVQWSAILDPEQRPIDLRGRFVRPSTWLDGILLGEEVEKVILDSEAAYRKDGPTWVTADDYGNAPDTLHVLVMGLNAGIDFRNNGPDSVNEKPATKYTFHIDAGKLAQVLPEGGITSGPMPIIGEAAIWLSQDNTVVKFHGWADLAGNHVVQEAARAIAGTPVPGAPGLIPVNAHIVTFDMELMQHNDQSLTVPTISLPTSTPTPNPYEIPTPIPDTTQAPNLSGAVRTHSICVRFTRMLIIDAPESSGGLAEFSFTAIVAATRSDKGVLHRESERWPGTGYWEGQNGTAWDLTQRICTDISDGDDLTIVMNGTEYDTIGSNDSMGDVWQVHTTEQGWGQGEHHIESTHGRGRFSITYTIEPPADTQR